MNTNTKILLLRYSDSRGVDTITEHKKIIDEYGSCWWAKIGKQPSPEYIKEILANEDRPVLLYTHRFLYKGQLGRIIRERPTDRYPAYYETQIFGTENEPSVYFELLSIEPENMEFLDDYIICSSGKPAQHDIKKSISSYMYLQHKSIPIPEKPLKWQTQTTEKKTPKKYQVDKSSCAYKKNGICSNKFCVNYKYECDRPQYCMRQKPLKIEIK